MAFFWYLGQPKKSRLFYFFTSSLLSSNYFLAFRLRTIFWLILFFSSSKLSINSFILNLIKFKSIILRKIKFFKIFYHFFFKISAKIYFLIRYLENFLSWMQTVFFFLFWKQRELIKLKKKIINFFAGVFFLILM